MLGKGLPEPTEAITIDSVYEIVSLDFSSRETMTYRLAVPRNDVSLDSILTHVKSIVIKIAQAIKRITTCARRRIYFLPVYSSVKMFNPLKGVVIPVEKIKF